MRHLIMIISLLFAVVTASAAASDEDVAPTCQVTPTSLNFGTVTVGSQKDMTFTVKNVGTGQLQGTVSEACDHYSIVSGGGTYKLSANQSITVTVRFEPTSAGTKTCAIQTGASCATVSCTGVGASAEIQVYLDIRPGSCPNPLNPDMRAPLSAAVLGTTDFDVGGIDASSLELIREGVAAGVAPNNSAQADVATPFAGPLCGCSADGPDGYMDLVIYFPLRSVVEELGLNGVRGQEIVLTLTGRLADGTPMSGSDCVFVLEAGKIREIMIMESPSVVNAESQFSFSISLEEKDHVHADVFDVHGRVVKTLMEADLDAGIHPVTWDVTGNLGRRVSTGIYFVRLSASARNETKKLVVVE
ncbi:MAG: choice-of-anchor D domain-containing protein [Candidatus Eisenbacteria bacterium]